MFALFMSGAGGGGGGLAPAPGTQAEQITYNRICRVTPTSEKPACQVRIGLGCLFFSFFF